MAGVFHLEKLITDQGVERFACQELTYAENKAAKT